MFADVRILWGMGGHAMHTVSRAAVTWILLNIWLSFMKACVILSIILEQLTSQRSGTARVSGASASNPKKIIF